LKIIEVMPQVQDIKIKKLGWKDVKKLSEHYQGPPERTIVSQREAPEERLCSVVDRQRPVTHQECPVVHRNRAPVLRLREDCLLKYVFTDHRNSPVIPGTEHRKIGCVLDTLQKVLEVTTRFLWWHRRKGALVSNGYFSNGQLMWRSPEFSGGVTRPFRRYCRNAVCHQELYFVGDYKYHKTDYLRCVWAENTSIELGIISSCSSTRVLKEYLGD
jgi:hypothetical protein